MIGYRIGTYTAGVATLSYLEDLGFTTMPFPSPFRPWSVVYPVANGASYGDGFSVCEWRFKILRSAEMAVLLGYIGAGVQSKLISLSTKDDSDVFADYKAYIHRPQYPDQGDRRPGGYWSNVVFKFTQLESI